MTTTCPNLRRSARGSQQPTRCGQRRTRPCQRFAPRNASRCRDRLDRRRRRRRPRQRQLHRHSLGWWSVSRHMIASPNQPARSWSGISSVQKILGCWKIRGLCDLIETEPIGQAGNNLLGGRCTVNDMQDRGRPPALAGRTYRSSSATTSPPCFDRPANHPPCRPAPSLRTSHRLLAGTSAADHAANVVRSALMLTPVAGLHTTRDRPAGLAHADQRPRPDWCRGFHERACEGLRRPVGWCAVALQRRTGKGTSI